MLKRATVCIFILVLRTVQFPLACYQVQYCEYLLHAVIITVAGYHLPGRPPQVILTLHMIPARRYHHLHVIVYHLYVSSHVDIILV